MLLNYRKYSSDGTPLVILHGLFGNLGNWGWHSKQLAESFAVYGVDLRNHGASFQDDELNYQVMAEDLKKLLIHLQIERCFLVGHSMGGKVAMQLAQTDPQIIEKLVVVDIAPVSYSSTADGHLNVMDGMESLDFSSISNRKDADEQLAKFVADEATRSFILTNLVREGEIYKWRINLPAIRKNYDRLREKPIGDEIFSKPVLFIRGGNSNYIQSSQQEEILKLFPEAKVKTVMEAGHWVHAEKPQLVLKIIQDFLLP
ncbi:MAG: alpha/beta fold hydrolase [Gammaproteobacteria bacterium]|nr:alpha/beta fold hydrolase [Gammaproteobacteria bacterium]MBT3860460.1 alpha/beta fold hydrolase [Gammaproteobacteria bacterium]MBT3987909.1 alpha/beta fold hydrolase [Gammaproteobacteria bacterium]MBT4257145.1 alpha/beta fold hydrolase [Gammaproteobacteria bacterium]MBT4582436.1 alpha/beta fold hydrolase [Gammaproteobacteria bacterium]